MQLGKLWIKTLKLFHLISENEYRRRKIRYLPHIDKTVLQREIDNFSGCGVMDEETSAEGVIDGGETSGSRRSPRLIITLTSFRQRLYDIHFTLYSLLNQSLKPDAVLLWLSEEEFPQREKELPESILKLRRNGLTVKWCQADLRSYKKLVPALKEYAQDILVTADDDIYYPSSWLELLYAGYLRNPKAVHCHRGHKLQFDKNGGVLPYKKWKHRINHDFASFHNFFTGAGGVLYPPHSLYRDTVEVKLFQRLAPNADDLWFWAMSVLNGTPVNIVDNNLKKLIYINPERELKLTSELTLAMVNTASGQNDRQLQQILHHYPQLMTYLS